MRKYLRRLVSLSGLQSKTSASAEEFLRRVPSDTPGCLLLDIMMPGSSGLDLQQMRIFLNKRSKSFIAKKSTVASMI